MEHKRLMTVVVISCFSIVQGDLHGFNNGQTFILTSVATGKVFTAGKSGNFSRNSPVVVTIWNEELNQKWLTLEASSLIQLNPTAREIQPLRYYLVPHRQQWDWKTITQNGTVNITNLSSLPPFTEVLSLDSITGNLTTEVFSQGSSSQQWIAEDAGQGQIFIRNLGNNQCVKNFDYKSVNLIQRIFSFINRVRKHQRNDPSPLSTLDCSAKDVSEKWLAEL